MSVHPFRAASTPASGLVVLLVGVLIAGCAASSGPAPTSAAQTLAADPSRDKLANVLARGTLLLSTDPAYPPQSAQVEGATRLAATRCAPNQLSAPEVEGYDADTGKAVAERLGVEACFVTPPWSEIIAGNWGDWWDVAWGSGALTTERMSRLYVTRPYYSTPHNFFVHADSPVQTATELSGKKVGACAGCTHELYLRHDLDLPGEAVVYQVDDPEIVTFDAEPPGLAATAAGDLDAFLAGEPVGTAAIAEGAALRMLPQPAYVTQKTGYLDRGSSLAQTAFAARIDEILRDLHADGSLKALSMRYFGVDYASAAGVFDLAALKQVVE